MKLNFIILSIICWLLVIGAYAQQLEEKVSVELKDKKLEEILNFIQAKHNINFSFINNELPNKHYTVAYKNMPLKQVLSELLKETELGFVEYDGQVIIKSGLSKEKRQPEVKGPNEATEGKSKAQASIEEMLEIEEEAKVASSVPDTIDTNQDQVDMDEIQSIGEEYSLRNKGIERQLEYFFNNDYDSVDYIKGTYHFGIFYPLSTHGLEAGRFVNQLSLHLLVGFSAALEGVEASLVGNIEKDYVKGFQYGGVFNIVRNDVSGAQFSNLLNVVGGNYHGLQYAHGLNITNGSFSGFQGSSFMNIAGGEVDGFQGAGFMNVALKDVDGFQAAGFMNFTEGKSKHGQVAGFLNIGQEIDGPQLAGFGNFQKGNGKGLQVAGFINQADTIYGAQLAGFINIAKLVRGFQGAGFINIGENVKGVQLGLINISDSLSGVPIGLFSIVRKNGYFDFEMFYADDFQVNSTLKIGAQKFHNIFGFSMEQLSYEQGSTNRWALGYGFGAQFGRKTLRLNTDLLGYHVFEKNIDNKPFKDNELNLLGKFKALASIHFGSFGIFGGPVFNVMVSQHQDDPESSVIGSGLVTDTFYNVTSNNKTNVKMWIGYNLGIRF